MQETLERFLTALRGMEVPVSPAEAIDAHLTVEAVGYGDRTLLKDALCAALTKTSDEVTRFDSCFDMFFSRDEFRAPETGAAIRGAPPVELPLAQLLLSGRAGALAGSREQCQPEGR